jgi:hypothetical protein
MLAHPGLVVFSHSRTSDSTSCSSPHQLEELRGTNQFAYRCRALCWSCEQKTCLVSSFRSLDATWVYSYKIPDWQPM